jgi:two-component system cell cycle sensor histidine kinase/response regulator CckA
MRNAMARILIADDEWPTRLEIEEMLTGLGYEVVGQAESGREAVDMARDLKPDLILMDVVMPGEINGIQAGQEIKAALDIPIIFISGYGDPESIEAAKQVEPFGYVMKPFDGKEMRAFVEIALYKREMELKLRQANDQLQQTNREVERQIDDRKENFDQLLLLLDSLDAALYVADMKTYEILFMNRYIRDLFGDRVGEICWQVLHDGQSGPCEFCTNDRLIASSGEPTGPIVWDHYNPKAGGWWEIRDQAIKWPDGRMVRLEIALDISRRKQAEESLRISQERLRQIIDFLPDATFVIDTEGKVIAWNHAIEKMTGIRAENMLGKGDFEYAIPFYGKRRPVLIDLVSRWDKAAEAAYKYIKKEWEALVSETYDCLVKPGGTLWNTASLLYDENGEVTGAIESIRDITERKGYEESLRESEERYRALFEQARDAIVITTEHGHVVDANSFALSLFGYTREEMLDLNFQHLYVDPDDGHRFLKKIQETGSVDEFFSRLRRSDGFEMDCTFNAVVHRDRSKGTILGYQGIIRDITESRRLQMQLQESRKMEAIATLAGGIAHQFNNALTPIIGNIDLLQMDHAQDDDLMDTLKKIKASAHRMAHLTSQLLAYARGGKYQAQVLPLAPFVSDTIRLTEHTLHPDVRVETDLVPGVSDINADLIQMQMVLSALIANANEAMEGPGRIRIAAADADLDQKFMRRHGLRPGPYVCLSVEDTGKGMDQETRKRIFDPFFTTHFLGRGLGMAAVYGIVKNHGGAIEVESALGKGTTVRICLPAVRAEGRGQGATGDRKREVEPGRVKGTVLVIEDEEMVMDLTQSMLKRLSYRVLEAGTGKEAVEIAKSFDGDIDLALLDIKLPDMSGREVYPLIMEERPGLKVVVCSGYAIDGPAQEILDAGAEAFMQKPFSLSTIAEKVRSALAGPDELKNDDP